MKLIKFKIDDEPDEGSFSDDFTGDGRGKALGHGYNDGRGHGDTLFSSGIEDYEINKF